MIPKPLVDEHIYRASILGCQAIIIEDLNHRIMWLQPHNPNWVIGYNRLIMAHLFPACLGSMSITGSSLLDPELLPLSWS